MTTTCTSLTLRDLTYVAPRARQARARADPREQLLSEMRAQNLQHRPGAAYLHQLVLAEREQARRHEWVMHFQEQQVAQGWWQEKKNRPEVERTRKEIDVLLADFERRIQSTQKAKTAWVGPLLQGIASGGLGFWYALSGPRHNTGGSLSMFYLRFRLG